MVLLQTQAMFTLRKIFVCFAKNSVNTGADPGFFVGGGALVSCSTSTPINYIVFLQNTSCIRKPQVISGGGAHPLHPPPRSAPATGTCFQCKRRFSPSKITHELSSNFKDAVKNIWRSTIFCQATKSFVPCQLPFVGSSYFANMTTKRGFWLYEKLSFTCLRCEQGCKNEKVVITKFPIFGKRQTLVFVEQGNLNKMTFLLPMYK